MRVIFTGTFEHQIDDKNRMRLPSKIRDQISGGFVVAKGKNNNLCIYTNEYKENLADRYDVMLRSDEKYLTGSSELEERQLEEFSSMEDVAEDKQGRFTLPQGHIEYARIVKDIIVMGSNNHIQIWGVEERKRHLEEQKANKTQQA